MRFMRFVAPVMVLAAGFMINTTLSYGKSEYTKKEKKACSVCHVTGNMKQLTEVGKCYQKAKSLQGCESSEKK